MDAVKVLFRTTHYFKLGKQRAAVACWEGVRTRSQISSLQFLGFLGTASVTWSQDNICYAFLHPKGSTEARQAPHLNYP